MGNKTRIFMYYLPQGMTLLKLSRALFPVSIRKNTMSGSFLMLMGFFGKFTLKIKRTARLDSSPRRSAFFCYTSRGKPHYFRQSYNNCIVL